MWGRLPERWQRMHVAIASRGRRVSVYSVITDGRRFLTGYMEGTSITERLTAANPYAEMVKRMAASVNRPKGGTSRDLLPWRSVGGTENLLPCLASARAAQSDPNERHA